jgi:Fe-S-cluster-containing dehydrogenase component
MGNIVTINEELCIGCGVCAEMCPQKILVVDEASGKCKVTDETQCDRKRGCVESGPSEAIQIA